MKNKLFQKKTISMLWEIILGSLIAIVVLVFIFKANSSTKTKALEIKSVASVMQADGSVTPQNQAILHFQLGGKLVYLPFREGDFVYQGQVIAKLDTNKLESNLRQAQQSFVAAKAVSDRYYDGRDRNAAESYDDKIKRTAIDAAQNIAYDNVVKAQQDISDASLVSPISGIVLQEDVDVTNINITPVTSFIVADPASLIFRTYVPENDIDFVSVGNTASIKLSNGDGSLILGTVSKIYPDKTTLSTGQKAYLVDIETGKENELRVIGQSGVALIQSNSQENVKLVPTWTVLDHDCIWVLANGKPVLRNVKVGKTHGDMTEILNGLKTSDKIITNPESVAAGKYTIL
jgi:RND family efflux transporter MFP subunit